MNQPVIYAVAAMLCYGISDFVYKRAAAAAVRSDHFLMAQAWFFLPLAVVYALATHTLVPDTASLWGCLAGIFAFVGFYFFSRSLAAGAISTNAAIFRMNFIVTVFLVVALLGEPLTPGKIAGLVLALLATWLLLATRSNPHQGSGEARRRSIIQVTVATLAFGASNFFHTVGLRHGAVPETLVVAQTALFMPLATGVVYLADRGLRPSPVTFKYGAVTATLLVAATVFLLSGIAGGQASTLVPIAQMGFIVAALLGIVVLRERMTGRKAIGLLSALAALAVLVGT
jgi:uncharacterized membrane protein